MIKIIINYAPYMKLLFKWNQSYVFMQLFASMLDIQYCLCQVPWSQVINYHLDWLPNFKANIRKRAEIKKQ